MGLLMSISFISISSAKPLDKVRKDPSICTSRICNTIPLQLSPVRPLQSIFHPVRLVIEIDLLFFTILSLKHLCKLFGTFHSRFKHPILQAMFLSMLGQFAIHLGVMIYTVAISKPYLPEGYKVG